MGRVEVLSTSGAGKETCSSRREGEAGLLDGGAVYVRRAATAGRLTRLVPIRRSTPRRIEEPGRQGSTQREDAQSSIDSVHEMRECVLAEGKEEEGGIAR